MHQEVEDEQGSLVSTAGSDEKHQRAYFSNTGRASLLDEWHILNRWKQGRPYTIKQQVNRQEIEDFLYDEADLLDQHHLDKWLSLFAEDAIYWIPCNDDAIDPRRHVSYIYDDRKALGDRVWRLQSGLAYGQDPPSRMSHIVSNVRIMEQSEEEIEAHAKFLIVELRSGKENVYSGKYVYRLKSV